MSVSLLLFRKSFKTGWKRLALMTGAVAIGIWIVLAFTAIFNAMSNTNRYAFQNSLSQQMKDPLEKKKIDGVDPVRIRYDYDAWRDQTIRIYTLEQTGPHSPDLLGLKVPAAGEYYVSEALAKTVKEHPDDQLGSRFGDKQLGTLPSSVTAGRDELAVIRGVAKGTVAIDKDNPHKNLIYQFSDQLPKEYQYTAVDTLMTYIIYLGVLIVLLPVIMLISISAKLGSIQREKRYAALRLVGATNGQVINVMATESLLSGLIGVVIGTLLYVVSLPLLQQLSLEETRYWPDMITVQKVQFIVIIILTMLLVWFANWWGMRKVHTSPLGIAQNDHREKKPGWWRFIPLVAGITVLICLQLKGHAQNMNDSQNNVMLLMLAIVLIMSGLVLAGSWLTYVLAKLFSRTARKPVTMIGMKYVQSHARAISRSVIGVVLALFAGSFFVCATSGIYKYTTDNASGYAILDEQSAIVQVDYNNENDKNGKLGEAIDKISNELKNANFVNSLYQLPTYGAWSAGECKAVSSHISGISCNDKDHQYLAINWANGTEKTAVYGESMTKLGEQIQQASAKSDWGLLTPDIQEQLDAGKPLTDISPSSYYYLLDIDEKDIDKLRTLVETSDVNGNIWTGVISKYEAHNPTINAQIEKLSWLAYAGMALTMVVAIISIVVSTIGGILERQRSLYTLRLSGMQVSELKRMIVVESLAPLIVTSLIAAGIGIYTAFVFVNNNSTTLRVNISPTYLLILLGSLALATLAIWLVLPLLAKVTNPANNQTE